MARLVVDGADCECGWAFESNERRRDDEMIKNGEHEKALRVLQELPASEQKALEELFIGRAGARLSAEEALTLVDYEVVPSNLTRRVLAAYDRVAQLAIDAGQDHAKVLVHGRTLRQQAFRRQLLRKAYPLCPI